MDQVEVPMQDNECGKHVEHEAVQLPVLAAKRAVGCWQQRGRVGCCDRGCGGRQWLRYSGP